MPDVSISSIRGAGSGNLRHSTLVVNCEAVLECAGVSNYSIDWDSRTVRLSKSDLKKIADYFAFELHSGTEGFEKYGWLWLLNERS
jgi:hypothetical protein